MMEIIIQQQNAKLDMLRSDTVERLERIEGPFCNRHHPTFNIANHPYYWGIEIREPVGTLFGI